MSKKIHFIGKLGLILSLMFTGSIYLIKNISPAAYAQADVSLFTESFGGTLN